MTFPCASRLGTTPATGLIRGKISMLQWVRNFTHSSSGITVGLLLRYAHVSAYQRRSPAVVSGMSSTGGAIHWVS